MDPDVWAQLAFDVYRDHHVNEVLYEVHYGGSEFAPGVFKRLGLKLPLKPVSAAVDKVERAQPVQALVSKGRLKLCGTFPLLERESTTWTPSDPPSKSPGRMDALVHGMLYLFPMVKVARGTVPLPPGVL
jgi:phage terminase large subunit-like protein